MTVELELPFHEPVRFLGRAALAKFCSKWIAEVEPDADGTLIACLLAGWLEANEEDELRIADGDLPIAEWLFFERAFAYADRKYDGGYFIYDPRPFA